MSGGVPSMRSRWSAAAPWITACALPVAFLLVAGVLLFPGAGHDDTHIAYWPAHTLADSGRILNYNGERVEQGSSLLHILLLAFLLKVTGADVVTLGRIAGIAAGTAMLVVLFVFVRGIAGRFAAHLAVWFSATCVYVVYWSFGGMETPFVPLVGLLLIIALARFLRDPASPSLLLPGLAMAACLTVRPESPILLGGMIAGLALVYWRAGGSRLPAGVDRRVMRGRLARLCALYGTLLALLLGFRLWVFGQWSPQPVRAKFGGLSWAALKQGLEYLSGSAGGMGPGSWALPGALAIGCAVVLGRLLQRNPWDPGLWLALLYTGGGAAFVLGSGGDWMEGGRFLVHFIPIAGALLAMALTGTGRKMVSSMGVAFVLIGLELWGIHHFMDHKSSSCPAWSEVRGGCNGDPAAYSWFERHSRINQRDMPVIRALDRWTTRIERRKREPILILSGQMGMVPYYIAERHFGRVRFIDLRGLVERSLTDCPAARGVGRTPMGLSLDYSGYFQLLEAQDSACRLSRPDFIFDIMSLYAGQVTALGYTMVYRQRGSVTCVDFPGAPFVDAHAFIAVRSELLGGEDLREVVQENF